MHWWRDGLAGCSLSSQPMRSSHCYCHSMIQTWTRCLSFSRLNSAARPWASKCSHSSRRHTSFPQQSPGCCKWTSWVFQGQEVVAGEKVFIQRKKTNWSRSKKRLMLTHSHFPRNFYCFHLESEQNQLLLKPPGWGNFHSKNIVQEILWLFYGVLIVFYYIYIISSYVMAGTPGMP